MNYNFDQVISRRRTNSVKYDFTAKYCMPENILPLWVADIDLPVTSGIQEALRACADHGIFGYTEPGQEYIRALQNWYSSHFGFSIESDWW